MQHTQNKIDRHRIRKLTHAVEQSACTVVITDVNGVIEYVNNRFEKLTGYSREEAIGKTPTISNSGQTKSEVYQNMWETIRRGLEWRGELLNKKKNGELYWASLTITPIKDDEGEIVNFLGIEEDITERKALLAKLEETLSMLTQTNRELSQFTSVVSHDLQGPLSTISNALELFLNGDSITEGEDSLEMVRLAKSCAEKAQGLVAELLQYARAGGRELEIKRVSIKKVVTIVLRNLEFEIEKSNANIVIEDLPTIVSSDVFLVQLLQNLIVNAIKYNDKPVPEILISAKQIADEWLFSIRDNGIGIPEQETANVFDAFFRASSAAKYSGTGLGLATCKRIVDRLGGKIWVNSKLGEGSTFCFTLPAKV